MTGKIAVVLSAGAVLASALIPAFGGSGDDMPGLKLRLRPFEGHDAPPVEWSHDDSLTVYAADTSVTTRPVSLTGSDEGIFSSCDSLPEGPVRVFKGPDGIPADSTAVRLEWWNPHTSPRETEDYLYGTGLADSTGHAEISIGHVGALAKLDLGLSGSTLWDTLELIPTHSAIRTATDFNVMTGALTATDSVDRIQLPLAGNSPLWFAAAPLSAAPEAIAAVARDTSGTLVTARMESGGLAPGTFAEFRGREWTDRQPCDLKFTLYNQYNLSSVTPKGQYSGITYVDDGYGLLKFAMVHDKQKGGAISYLRLILNRTIGFSVTPYSCEQTPGNAASSEDRDAEGIAWVPATGTFFVAGEDQRIVEYDADGYPTGRELSIPEDMTSAGIQHDYGFESLTYNAATDLLWTTTEHPLKRDTDAASILPADRPLVRLQSFDRESLEPARRYLYLCDAPEGISAGAKSYVHGVSDLCALDDGRLIVMEREVLVPQSYVGGWCHVKLYVVDPVHDPGGILSKSLATDFWTVLGISLTLANYEGMCLGPVCDGKQTLLLVCDSQGGAGKSTFLGDFHLSDWIKIITIE